MNQLAEFSSNNNIINELAREILNKKWPKDENDQSIFNFIFECDDFLKVFFFIG